MTKMKQSSNFKNTVMIFSVLYLKKSVFSIFVKVSQRPVGLEVTLKSYDGLKLITTQSKFIRVSFRLESLRYGTLDTFPSKRILPTFYDWDFLSFNLFLTRINMHWMWQASDLEKNSSEYKFLNQNLFKHILLESSFESKVLWLFKGFLRKKKPI